jgi:catechol 2,3-dioxygenase-like lactoylglutathione lyase family enzyme
VIAVLHHVSLETNPPDADRFAALLGILGFAEVEEPGELSGVARWFERAGTQIHLLLTEGATAPALGHAAVVVADFPETLAAVREAGFELLEARELWGARRAFVTAPGEHRIELMERPPG